jgi:hypothetical protein
MAAPSSSAAVLPVLPPGASGEWLLLITYAGMELLLGEQAREIETAAGELLLVQPGLPEIEITEAIRLPGDTSTALSLSLSLVLPVSVAELTAAGLPLSTGRASLARWIPGTTWEQRRIVLDGRLRDPEYGEDGEPVAFTVEEQPWQVSARLPARTQRVDGTTWADSILQLQEAHLGAVYPIVIGRPGAKSDGTRASGAPARWVWHDPYLPGAYGRYTGLVLVVAGHHVSAERVYVHLDEYPAGWRAPVFNGTDSRGQPVAYIPWYATISGTDEPYEYDPAGSYADSLTDFDGDDTYGLGAADLLPNGTAISALTITSSQPQFWISWDDEESSAHGGLTVGGKLIRSAGDVLAWLLRRTGRIVDAGSVAAAAPILRGFRLDFSIYSDCDLWEFLQAHLLPILPVALSTGVDGWRIAVWRWEATAADAVAELEAGAGASRVSSVSEDASSIRNRFRLQFSRSARTGAYTEEVSLSGDPYDAEDVDAEPSSICRISSERYGETEEEVLTSDVVYDRATARLILRHRALTYALPRVRVRYQIEERIGWRLQAGDIVTATDPGLRWSRRVWIVEEVIWRSGIVEVGLITGSR